MIIKIGLKDILALTFANLRYLIGFPCLLPFALRAEATSALRQLSGRDWSRHVLLDILFITVTQGAQFLALTYLSAVTTALLLNFTSIVVALAGIIFLAERPNRWQRIGIRLNLIGVFVYFHPWLPDRRSCRPESRSASAHASRTVNEPCDKGRWP